MDSTLLEYITISTNVRYAINASLVTLLSFSKTVHRCILRLSSDLTVFRQQPASDTDSACPACETLLGYSYLVAAPW